MLLPDSPSKSPIKKKEDDKEIVLLEDDEDEKMEASKPEDVYPFERIIEISEEDQKRLKEESDKNGNFDIIITNAELEAMEPVETKNHKPKKRRGKKRKKSEEEYVPSEEDESSLYDIEGKPLIKKRRSKRRKSTRKKN